MKNTILTMAGVTIVTLVFLLYQANLAVDSSEEEKFTMIELAYTEACLGNTISKAIIECKEDAYFYVQELKRLGW